MNEDQGNFRRLYANIRLNQDNNKELIINNKD